MREGPYHPKISGEVRYSDTGTFSYFWPNDLPFDFTLDKKTNKKLETALIALSKLDGKVSQIPEEERNTILIPFMLLESIGSSSIEGISTTVEDLYLSERIDEIDPLKIDDIREVLNYRDALDYVTHMDTENISEILILKLHQILMDGVRNDGDSSGKYREVQVLVGSKGNKLDNARFVPVPPEQIPLKMRNLLDYINDRYENTLMCSALAHYQFETIHPFTDGNGRLGRLLIMLILNRGGLLEYPVLNLSDYFNNCREDYYDCLNHIREYDDFNKWVNIFLDALITQSKKSAELMNSLLSYRKELHESETDLNGHHLIDSLFTNPYIRKIDVSRICDIHPSTAGRLVTKFVEKGVLTEITGKKRNQVFVCKGIVNILNSH